MLDSVFALVVLAFILVTGLFSIGAYARTAPAPPQDDSSLVLGAGIRDWYIANLQPLEDRCIQWGIQPAQLSYVQLAASVVVALCYANGLLFTGGWLLLFTGSFDIVDGRVARRTNVASARGAFLDSVVDRYADALAFFGLAILFRDSWMLWVVLSALLGCLMVSYARARAESLGVDCRVGLLQRPERYVLLGFGTMFGALFDHLTGPWLRADHHYFVTAVVIVLALLSNLTALQRVVHAWRILAVSPHA